MRRRSRTRRVLKWTGTGMCVLILAAFALTPWWYFGSQNPMPGLLIMSGSVHLLGLELIGVEGMPHGKPEWEWSRNLYTPAQWPSQLSRWMSVEPGSKGTSSMPTGAGTTRAATWYMPSTVIVPLWIPFVLVLVPTAFLWWRDRRRIPLGHCQHCGYDLTGNVTGRCPECGTPIDNDKAPDTNG